MIIKKVVAVETNKRAWATMPNYYVDIEVKGMALIITIPFLTAKDALDTQTEFVQACDVVL